MLSSRILHFINLHPLACSTSQQFGKHQWLLWRSKVLQTERAKLFIGSESCEGEGACDGAF
ncbi:NADH-ubiquinone oxidoreductase chain 5 [Clarias magur]|uniref:NADH-ubiquinone oxidoreductase chain 5 n=1 Tax=Clarias magur TaxID=1594786 RepID=A0A8J4UNV1_CLAMG|nr:NADH-ubiquinone oxidoreductase chain 5 [Clarias magur]